MPDRPPRILIFSGVQGDTRRYRTFHLAQQLRLAGVDAVLSHLTDPALPALASGADVLVMHRVAHDRYVDSILARAPGALRIVDVDDLVFDPSAFAYIDSPDFRDPVRARTYRAEMTRQRELIEQSQAVTASTAFLVGQASRTGVPAFLHRNAFSLEMLAASDAALKVHPERDPQRVTIGYASGTLTHNRDFALVAPVLQDVLRRYPQVSLRLVGRLHLDGSWAPFAGRVQRAPFVPWRELPAQLAAFDINLAPLVLDNPFSQSKSEIKWVEAGLVRVPTVASATQSFIDAVVPGETGMLAAAPEDWEQALSALIESPELRAAIGLRAYADLQERYHPTARARELVTLLNAAAREARGEPLWHSLPEVRAASPESFFLPAEIEIQPTLARRAAYSLRRRGLRTLAAQVWIFFRRLAAPVFPFK